MARAKQAKIVKQMTVSQLEAMFPDEDACKAYLTARRWPDGVRCPRCDNPNVYDHSSYAPYHWQCRNCEPNGYRFSVLVGTVFENTNMPLKTWFRVIHAMLTSQKGVSALQLFRTMDIGSYKTAWYMCHRVRAGLQDEEFRKLVGIVEVDETFIGGLAKNRHKDKRGGGGGTSGIGSGKTPVVGAVSRKGNVVARVIENVLGERYPHGVVDHAKGQYVVGAIHTNTIEGFWSIFKRGVVGTFHKVSRKYMPLYVAEFEFPYNNRQNPDIFGTAMKAC